MENEEKCKKKKRGKRKKSKKSRSLSPETQERLDGTTRVYRDGGTPPRHRQRLERRLSDDSQLSRYCKTHDKCYKHVLLYSLLIGQFQF